MDRLSQLPDVLIEKILLNMAAFDAVRTCVLSKHWQYKWIKLPKLLLDVSFFIQTSSVIDEPSSRYIHIVNSLLKQHEGPLKELYLLIPDDTRLVMPFVLTRAITKLTIHKWGQRPYIWPSSFPCSHRLTYLELRYCDLNMEPFCRGFQNLISLVFDDVKCDEGTLSRCISNTPNLEKLVLLNLDLEGGMLGICAPKLQYLIVRGFFKYVKLQQGFNLKEMEMCLESRCEYSLQFVNHLVEFFGNLTQLESLRMDAGIYKIFPEANYMRELPVNLGQLRVIRLTSVEFWNDQMLYCFLCIIHSSPRLRKLEIIASSPYLASREDKLRLKSDDHKTMEHLKQVYIGPISGTKNELSIIKHVLHCSPALQEMAIWNVGCARLPDCEIFSKALARLHRASASVVVNVFSCYRDNYFQT